MKLNRWQIGVVTGLSLVVSGCQMGGTGGGKDGAVQTMVPGNSAAGEPSAGERDVEAPAVFNMKGKALWDGRPSLGGVWVAHTNVKDPERVIIRNPANGKSVVGALFRREVDNPGPSLQLSSDAADALGLLAGQPADIEVVALKREEVAAPAPAAQTAAQTAAATKADGAAAKGKTAGSISSAPIEPVVATANAALDKAAKKGSKGTPPATVAAAAAGAGTKQATKQGKAQPSVAPAPAVASTATGAATPTQRPFLQIGIFSVEANAKKAAAQMQKAGLAAQVKQDKSANKTFWRVIIGPAATVAARDQAAARVKALGYPDAYPVSK